MGNWKKKSNWNDQWDNNKLRKNTDWNDGKAKQVEGFENQNHQGNEQTKKELLQKELEDEALQKLRELDRKILKLQAESLKEKEENNKMKRKWIFERDMCAAYRSFVIHSFVSFAFALVLTITIINV